MKGKDVLVMNRKDQKNWNKGGVTGKRGYSLTPGLNLFVQCCSQHSNQAYEFLFNVVLNTVIKPQILQSLVNFLYSVL